MGRDELMGKDELGLGGGWGGMGRGVRGGRGVWGGEGHARRAWGVGWGGAREAGGLHPKKKNTAMMRSKPLFDATICQ